MEIRSQFSDKWTGLQLIDQPAANMLQVKMLYSVMFICKTCNWPYVYINKFHFDFEMFVNITNLNR